MQRFFVLYNLGEDIEITEANLFHQLTRVLRTRVDDYIVLFNGDKSEHIYQMESI